MFRLSHSIVCRAVFALICLAVLSGCMSRSAPRYTITDIGTPRGSSIEVSAMNNQGHVIGSTMNTWGRQLIIWQNGKVIDAGTMNGHSTMGHCINDRGEIVGMANIEDKSHSISHAFLYTRGKYTDLTLYIKGATTQSINNRGEILLSVNSISSLQVWKSGHGRVVPLPFKADLLGEKINDNGWISGLIFGKNSTFDGFILKPNGQYILMHQPGKNSYVACLNKANQAIGLIGENPFLWTEGWLHYLPKGPYNDFRVAQLNNHGQIVGESNVGAHKSHAALYENGRTVDLNDLIPHGSGWILERAIGINDKGEIIGTGIQNSQIRSFLLRPLKPNKQ